MRRSKLTDEQLNRYKKGLCIQDGCFKSHAKKIYLCYRHRTEAYKAKYPIKYAYQTLRTNAKRRGKKFDISLDYFKKFCVKTKILLGRGIQKNSYHIDRIDESRGYVEGNLQVLTNVENIKKYIEYDYLSKKFRIHKKSDDKDYSDVPF